MSDLEKGGQHRAHSMFEALGEVYSSAHFPEDVDSIICAKTRKKLNRKEE